MRKYLFIVNPISGGKDKQDIVRQIRRSLDSGRLDGDIRVTEAPGDAMRWAWEADADVVVAVGGDGTVSEVAKGLVGSGKILGILPCGSGDGLALHLGVSRTAAKALDTLVRGNIVDMDYAMVNGQPFFCAIGMGLDAIVAEKFAHSRKRGIETYIAKALESWQHFKPSDYKITVDGVEQVLPAVSVTIGNANQWGNEARITSLASVQDGLLDVAVVLPFHTLEIPLLASKLLDGRAHTSRRVEMLRGRKVHILRDAPGPVHVDGEPSEMGAEITAEIIPASLKVIVPPHRTL